MNSFIKMFQCFNCLHTYINLFLSASRNCQDIATAQCSEYQASLAGSHWGPGYVGWWPRPRLSEAPPPDQEGGGHHLVYLGLPLPLTSRGHVLVLHCAGPDEGQAEPLLRVGVRGGGGGAREVRVTQGGQGHREAGARSGGEQHPGNVVTGGEQGEAVSGHPGPQGHPPGHLLRPRLVPHARAHPGPCDAAPGPPGVSSSLGHILHTWSSASWQHG